MDNVERLMEFGLTRHEASLYILLVLEGSLNGYEAAKRSSISRSNAYNALAGLVEKGAAYMQEEDTVRYTPVPVEEFCSGKIRHMEKKKKELMEQLPEKRKDDGGYLTIKGEEHICDKIIEMLIRAKERAYVSIYNERLEGFREYLEQMVAEDKKVVIITNEPFDLPGATVYLTECRKEQIRLITDSNDVLTGEITNQYDATCLYSSNSNLVEVFKDALANEIQLLNMKKGIQ
ncbi:MAG TPA: TrmB family transcriptional regulator [Candidatus Anaerostipes excrementavium]|uniref:TrmB family transcriptional regulator n=1 Tax=Candidatus Anaerostipes excrementavium TaxID=2838463 RepID=A0A9D1WTZ9_9FIRM|nr:TrmB family transcriptional regulator [uncultured Anaerostipes sp.]HIX66877.1 TrmB family transcriptional regulator [Candidatus Anaerostipes excrementavium]